MAEESGRSFARRDKLLEIESEVQKLWSEGDVFRAEPKDAKPKEGEKFYGNFPFPYMNGYLHLGHAFSLSKLEFAAAYHRLRGANVLLPFAFHCTGMPIKASADKLKREIERFGNPPVFPAVKEEETGEHEGKPEGEADGNQAHPGGKFKGKKSKVVAKSGGIKYQWEIMQSYGLSDEEIAKFTNPYHWLTFFPPLAVEDLKAFGLGCDWRRTFITTDMNPYFDSFVRWQVRKLKDMGKIVKDLRYTIYSPLDGQPCADHDRASGEGVIPQEYTLIKMEVISPFPPKMSALEGKKVYLAAATLRPETMYGQTNCWVLPDGKYGAFEINDTQVFILTRRAALNLAYQKLSRVPEKPTCLLELTGQDLIGLPLKAPLAYNDVIYTLPMLSVLTDKGTGIVTSVPSDSPDDYMALHDLKGKPAFRAKYGVKDEWILPFEIIPIIQHPDFGDKSAERVCIEKKIKSQNEREKLDEAKKIIYKGGFYEGTMLVGEFTGLKVQEAKGLIRSKLLELEQAVVYSEPEKKVMSRSGDECVVALTDQWYITYGEQEWKKAAVECLAGMNLYSDETRHGFEHTLSWLNQWACSRSFGLGTRIPWDEEFLVESLSDSTLYMAYYTVAHMLQRGDMYGADRSSVKPEQLTDEVWDFLFVDGPYPKSSDLPPTLLSKMKQEFEYWYPFDLRVSGKDLIQNHLTFCIYNHAAIMPKHHWPKGFRCNGHIMLNSEKMSKSTGNFRTLRQAIEEFSADATRFSLADAGDGMDDANFVFETANAAILRLTKEISWMEEVIAAESSLRNTPPTTYADRVFANEMNIAVKSTEKNFSDYMFREALKSGFYDLQAARDEYRLSCGAGGMNRDLLWRFMDIQTRLIAPICPHYAEYVWKELLKKGGYVVKAGWPEADSPDLTLKKANKYLQDTIVSMRKLLQKQATGSKKGGKTCPTNAAQSVKPTTGLIFVNEQYDGWKKECLNILKRKFDSATCTFAPDQEILSELAKSDVGQSGNFKQIQKLCMPFLRFKKDEVKAVGVQALELKLPFGEIEVLVENVELIKRQLGLEHLEVVSNADGDAVARAGDHAAVLRSNPPSPGAVEFEIVNGEILPDHSNHQLFYEIVAASCNGYVGADLEALCREAAMSALKNSSDTHPDVKQCIITMDDWKQARTVVGPSITRGVTIEIPKVSWDDIGGLKDVKKKLQQAVEWPIKHSSVFSRLGISPMRGILLHGPPGCSKTTLAKAAACGAQASFFSLSGAELYSMYVGEGEALLRNTFRKARLAAPSIIFFDEADVIAAKRGGNSNGSSTVGERLLSTLLTEMDGLEQAKGILVLAATNRPYAIDAALMRPGRFDLVLYVPPPDREARHEILRVHTRKMKIEDGINLEEIARDTELFTGAELEGLCKEAGIVALREDISATVVRERHFRVVMRSLKPGLTETEIESYASFMKNTSPRPKKSSLTELDLHGDTWSAKGVFLVVASVVAAFSVVLYSGLMGTSLDAEGSTVQLVRT